MRRAPDEKLSFLEAVRDVSVSASRRSFPSSDLACTSQSIASEFTVGRLVDKDYYHVAIVRSQLTRNIAAIFDDVKEEIALGYDEEINANDAGEGFPYARSELFHHD